MTDEEKIYEALAAPFPEGAIERTKKEETKKGYDTTGVKYQFVVNRFNEVLGVAGWSFPFPEILKHTQGTFKSGTPYHEITVRADIKIHYGEMKAERSCVGGHIGGSYADALKGAITNAFKKTAGFFGVGRQAYEGTLDDDATQPDAVENVTPTDKRFSAPMPAPAGSPPPAGNAAGAAPRDGVLPPAPRGPAGGAPFGVGSPPAQPQPIDKPFPSAISQDDHNKRMEILDIAQNINRLNGQSIENLIRQFSEFTGNDGHPVFREDVAQLKGRWLNATLGRARELWKTFATITLPSNDTTSPDPNQPAPPAPPMREPGADEEEDLPF